MQNNMENNGRLTPPQTPRGAENYADRPEAERVPLNLDDNLADDIGDDEEVEVGINIEELDNNIPRTTRRA